ncbi:MAG TPA: hypothetical protein VE972_06130 [Conexibacter sp.]|nr:hypothetical protein [Conexibacter sp.]
MPSLEDITYEAGRHALFDQEAFVAGIRQRTGTLLAAHALLASFLGAASIGARGFDAWGWVALAALVLGLVVAAVLLAPWDLTFAADARSVYDRLYEQAAADRATGATHWLVAAAYGYQDLHRMNLRKVRRMSRMSGLLGLLMVIQTLTWIVDLAL